VQILPGKEGLVHISQLATTRVDKVEDVVQVGDELKVKVMEIDGQGRVNLSHKALLAGGDAPSGNGAFRPRRSDDASAETPARLPGRTPHSLAPERRRRAGAAVRRDATTTNAQERAR